MIGPYIGWELGARKWRPRRGMENTDGGDNSSNLRMIDWRRQGRDGSRNIRIVLLIFASCNNIGAHHPSQCVMELCSCDAMIDVSLIV